MTDTPTSVTDDPQAAPAAEGDATPVPADAGAAAPATVAEPEPTPFWQRPLVEKFLVPLVIPIIVVVGLVAYILNLSRIFLSAHGHIPVIIGTIILLVILIGAALLSYASPRMRQSAITLICGGFVLAIMGSGWLVLGHSQPEKTGPTTLPSTLKTSQTLAVTAAPGSALKFVPDALTAKTGLAKIDVTVAGAGHTFTMQDPTTLFEQLSLNAAGTKVEGVAFFPAPGTYTFFCSIPGHEAAGMKGTITVAGPPMTLDAALKASGNPPGAAG
jgi:plastocyanin